MEKSAIKIFIITLLSVFALSGCGGGGSDKAPAKDNNAKTTDNSGKAPAKDNNAKTTDNSGKAPAKDNNAKTTDNSGKAPAKDNNAKTTDNSGKAPAKDNNAKTTLLKVTAIDGYLKGALVCLDVNDNQQCDESEPHNNLGTDKGEYTLEIPNDIQSNKHKIIVSVIKDITIDMDNSKKAVSESYLMTAPMGKAIITPITTLIDHKIVSGLDMDIAVQSVIANLGLPSSSNIKNVMGDYIAMTDENSQYLRLVGQEVAKNAKLITELVNHDKKGDSQTPSLQEQLKKLSDTIKEKKIRIYSTRN